MLLKSTAEPPAEDVSFNNGVVTHGVIPAFSDSLPQSFIPTLKHASLPSPLAPHAGTTVEKRSSDSLPLSGTHRLLAQIGRLH